MRKEATASVSGDYCVLYCRVSTKDQKEKGLSLEAQESLLKEWAVDNELAVVKKFIVPESASKPRKVFNATLEFCKANNIKNILVEKLDRLHRDDPEDVVLIERYRKDGYRFFLVKDNEVLDEHLDAKRKFVYKVRSAAAGFVRDNIREESLKGTKVKLERGEFPGAPPLGYQSIQKTKNRPHMIVQTEDAPKVKRFLELFNTGKFTVRQALRLTKDIGLRPKRKNEFTKGTLAKIIKNRFYYGEFEYSHPWINEGKPLIYLNKTMGFESIITKKIWEENQEILKKRQTNLKENQGRGKTFKFNNLLTCGKCGRAIFGEKFSHEVKYQTKKKGLISKRYDYPPRYHCTRGIWYSIDGKSVIPKEYVDEETLTIKEDVTYKEEKTICDDKGGFLDSEMVEKILWKKGTKVEARRCDMPTFWEHEIERMILDKVSLIKFDRKVWEKIKEKLFREETKEFLDTEIRILRSELTKSETNLDSLYEDWKAEVIDVEFFKKRSSEIRDRQEEIRSRLEELDEERQVYDEKIGKAIEVLDSFKNWEEKFKKADDEKRNHLLRLITIKIFTWHRKATIRGKEREWKDLQIIFNDEFRELFELGVLELAEEYKDEIEAFLVGKKYLNSSKLRYG